MLNLYFLPVALSGLFLGRHRSAALALLCIVTVSPIAGQKGVDASLNSGQLIIPLAVTVWAAVLSMMALLIGSLSDDRNRKVKELQESHLTETLSDPLTGVANRRAFEYELQRRLIEWRRQHMPLALVMIDVDHFKRVQ